MAGLVRTNKYFPHGHPINCTYHANDRHRDVGSFCGVNERRKSRRTPKLRFHRIFFPFHAQHIRSAGRYHGLTFPYWKRESFHSHSSYSCDPLSNVNLPLSPMLYLAGIKREEHFDIKCTNENHFHSLRVTLFRFEHSILTYTRGKTDFFVLRRLLCHSFL